MTILLYLPDVSIAQHFAIVAGSSLGAAIGTMLSWCLGFVGGGAHRFDRAAFREPIIRLGRL